MFYFLRYSFVFILFSLSPVKAGKVEMDVHHAGQGNCVLVKFTPNDGDTTQVKHMLVDVGSSSYKKEMAWMKELMVRDKRNAGKSPSPGVILSSSPAEGSSREGGYDSGGEERDEEEGDNFLIQKLRRKLEKKRQSEESNREGNEDELQKPPISIHTIVITHPDRDHYGWLKRLLSEDTDHVEHIIFGGLPEHYDMSESLMLNDWIIKHMSMGTKVYFPAISYEPIASLENVLPSDGRTYAPHRCSAPDSKIKTFEEAFNFGPNFNVDLLSVNPSHFQGRGGILRSSYPEDDNVSSLVLRIGHGDSSAILTGDATGITTSRILDNYFDQLKFLRVNVLLASHHGSSSHGSNNEAWIDATQPEVVLISNGLSQGHPHEEAYQLFKKSQRLKKAIPREKVRGS